jgi:hypothetical protein
MILTQENFFVFAAKHYDNPYCFTESEFQEDLKKISTIKRMIMWMDSPVNVNIHLIINNIISFYNVFDHHAGSQMLEFRTEEHHHSRLNAFLCFLSLPLVGDQEYDLVLHRRIAQEFK